MGVLFALIDCNNFYVSCERLFQPMLRFLPTFGDGLKRNTVCSVCTSYARHVGKEKRYLHAGASPTWCTWARVALRWPATPHGMAGDLPRTLAITPRPTSGGPRGDAASTRVWAGARAQAVWAGPSRGIPTKRRRRRSRCARPNIWRFSIFSRLIWPSTGPLLQGSVTPALTA